MDLLYFVNLWMRLDQLDMQKLQDVLYHKPNEEVHNPPEYTDVNYDCRRS